MAKIKWLTFMVLTILKQLKFSEDWQISSNELHSTSLPKLSLSVGMGSDFYPDSFFLFKGILYFL